MSDFMVALGLLLVIEGLFYCAGPGMMKRLAAQLLDMPEHVLRGIGLAAMMAGIAVIWFVRG